MIRINENALFNIKEAPILIRARYGIMEKSRYGGTLNRVLNFIAPHLGNVKLTNWRVTSGYNRDVGGVAITIHIYEDVVKKGDWERYTLNIPAVKGDPNFLSLANEIEAIIKISQAEYALSKNLKNEWIDV